MNTAPKTLLVGIDEAGYGPVLGPLVVSASAFEVPVECEGVSLWSVLSQSVTEKASVKDARVRILDSKKLHKPQDGLSRIERTALAAAHAWLILPARLKTLLASLAPECVEMLQAYPWYAKTDPALPLSADDGGVRIAGNLMRRDMEACGIRLTSLMCEVLPEGHYNRMVDRIQNKAVVLMGLTLRLMQRIADANPGRQIRFLIDKQGGRNRYVQTLMKGFEDRKLKVLEESLESSSYELVRGDSSWRVSFSKGGEGVHLPTALASIMSKYVREALMHCFNEYWTKHLPSLRPTAGYYEDGLRFLADIRPLLGKLGVREEQLVRVR
jgi:ribonuclease HII